MSAIPVGIFVIYCDKGNRCRGNFEQVAANTEQDARKKLTKKGWVFRNELDYCPSCAFEAGFHA